MFEKKHQYLHVTFEFQNLLPMCGSIDARDMTWRSYTYTICVNDILICNITISCCNEKKNNLVKMSDHSPNSKLWNLLFICFDG